MPRTKRRAPGAGRPVDPKALRRTGVRLSMLLSSDDHAAYAARAAARRLRLSEHVRDLLARDLRDAAGT